MKFKFFKSKTFLYIISIFILSFMLYYTYVIRYSISEPMMDLSYKKSIIKDSHNIFYKLENLRPIVGEQELLEFIKQNNNNPDIYTPSEENIKNGTFRANLHMHTLQSDGIASVEKRLDMAQKYGERKGGYMYIAITDHNTINGAKEVVKILQKNPKKYKNVKVVLGMEAYTAFNSKYYKKPIEIHVLNWCLNPYNKFLNKEFYKPKDANKWNRKKPDRNFDDLIPMMSKYAIPGIAHPVRYTNRIGKNKYLYINEMMERYRKLSTKPLFAEGYYQAYPRYYKSDFIKEEIIPYANYINNKADEYNIIKTGSTDSHSKTIFD